MKKKFKQRKQYFYLIAYKFKTKNGDDGYGCKTISKNNINVTQLTFDYISELAKKYNNDIDTEKLLITSVSYLGRMTEKEFYDEPTK